VTKLHPIDDMAVDYMCVSETLNLFAERVGVESGPSCQKRVK